MTHIVDLCREQLADGRGWTLQTWRYIKL